MASSDFPVRRLAETEDQSTFEFSASEDAVECEP